MTNMADVLCTHCNNRIRWDAEEQCFICFNPDHYMHRQFELGSNKTCPCFKCFDARRRHISQATAVQQ